MRFFVFGREIAPKWFVDAVNADRVVYQYKGNHVTGFLVVENGQVGTFGSTVCKGLDGVITVLK